VWRVQGPRVKPATAVETLVRVPATVNGDELFSEFEQLDVVTTS
jgi:hypothetical protein